MGRGGSRWGAGRPARKGKAEHCLRLNLNKVRQAGLLRSGASGIWAWHRDGNQIGTVGLRCLDGLLRVECQIDGSEAGHAIPLDFTPCFFGGVRPWFRCPSCFRRTGVLFLRGGAPFRCRHCARLAYSCQSEDEIGRTWRRQIKIEGRLTENGCRPKGMHWRTFERLQAAIDSCEVRRELALADAMQRMGLLANRELLGL